MDQLSIIIKSKKLLEEKQYKIYQGFRLIIRTIDLTHKNVWDLISQVNHTVALYSY